MATRPYELKRRAEQRDETRRRIVDAAIALHSTLGPARTTVSEIAERAGVGRVTVYRHFPDEMTLARACSGHYFASHPFPDVDAWSAIESPEGRLRAAVRESFAWYAENAEMIGRVLADARDHPVMAPYHRHWDQAAAAVAAAWRARGRRRERLVAAIALALSFDTYRTLVVERGLPIDEAAELLLPLAASVSAARRGSR
jgi:AcrR family transcriptional regulator